MLTWALGKRPEMASSSCRPSRYRSRVDVSDMREAWGWHGDVRMLVAVLITFHMRNIC